MKKTIMKDDRAFKQMVKDLKQRRHALGVEGLPSDAETTIRLWKAKQAKSISEEPREALIIVEHGNGIHRAYSPMLPGHWFEGQSQEEATAKLLNALKKYVNELAERGESLPRMQATVDLVNLQSVALHDLQVSEQKDD